MEKCGGIEVLIEGLHRAVNRLTQDMNYMHLAVEYVKTLDTIITDSGKWNLFSQCVRLHIPCKYSL